MRLNRVLFLGSGGGGNLKFINEYNKEINFIELCGVLVDRNCGALEYAQSEGLSNDILTFERNIDADQILIDRIKTLNPDIIITNVHKILSKRIVREFSGKLVNLHYSYLPAYGGVIGMKPVDLAIERNNTFIGTTCHFVTEEVDAGKIISQGIFNRLDNSQNVYQKTFETGALTLLSAIYHLKYEDTFNRTFNGIMISPSSEKINMDFTSKIFSKLNK